jgi:methylmalonyl-CoA mutase
MKNLFEEFKPVDYQTWLDQLKKDLKDKPLEALVSKPEMDLEIRAFYHPQNDQYNGPSETAANQFHRHSNEWKVRRAYLPGSNAKILADLENGIDAIGLHITSQTQFDADTKGVMFEYIISDVRFDSIDAAISFTPHIDTHLNFDVIALNAERGEPAFSLDQFHSFYKAHPIHKTIWVSGSHYGDAGATTTQELAFALAHLNEYLQLLHDKGELPPVTSSKITIELSVSENYFVNIAKFRVIRELVALLLTGYQNDFVPPAISLFAKTGERYLAENDPNNNLLRATTQAMSAIIGGCDVLTVTLPGSPDKQQHELNGRMAKNIPLVLREESYFDKVVDGAAGSYYIESLTEQLLQNAWNLFLEIEAKGGLVKCLETNFVQDQVGANRRHLIDQVNSGKQTFLGINKFQSKLEKWKTVTSGETQDTGTFKKITPFRLEPFYIQKTVTA